MQVVVGRHPYTGDEVTAVRVFRHTGAATVVAVIRQACNEHATGQRVIGMGPHNTASLLDEVIDGAMQLGGCRVRVDIEDEDLAGV